MCYAYVGRKSCYRWQLVRNSNEVVFLSIWSNWFWWKLSGSLLSRCCWPGWRGIPDARRSSPGLPASSFAAAHSSQHVSQRVHQNSMHERLGTFPGRLSFLWPQENDEGFHDMRHRCNETEIGVRCKSILELFSCVQSCRFDASGG